MNRSAIAGIEGDHLDIQGAAWVDTKTGDEPKESQPTIVATDDGLVFPADWDADINEWVTPEADIIQFVTHWSPMPLHPAQNRQPNDG